MQEQILKLIDLKPITGMSGSSIYRGAANGTFPKPIKLGERSSGWLRSEVDEWLNNRIEASRNSEVS
jgi:prophage regulatory protein